jgi:hypothetical protein
MVALALLTGVLIGAAAASLVALGWAASRFRWLGAHCDYQITHWRNEAIRARTAATQLRAQPEETTAEVVAGPAPGSGRATGR